MELLAAYAPGLSADGLTSLLSTLVVLTGCTAFGAAIGRGSSGNGTDLIVGVGLAGGLLALWGVAGLPLSYGAGGLGILALGALFLTVRRGVLPGGTLWRTVLILLPLLLIGGGAIATMWDDFFHWLPNAAYVVRYDRLPAPGLPESLSKWPAYPHTMPFIVAVSSWLTGHFQESAGAIANIVFVASFGAVLAELAAGERPSSLRTRWAVAALGAVLATLLNPAFLAGRFLFADRNILFTSYSDIATAQTLLVCALLGAGLVAAVQEYREERARALAWRFGLAATALINLKQANLVLLALILAALGLMTLMTGGQAIRQAVRRLPAMLIVPAIVFVVWRYQAMVNAAGGEMAFRALDTWNTAEFPRTLEQAWLVMTESPAFFTLAYVVTGLGLWAWWRPDTLGKRLLAMTAVVWIGYNLFLAAVYLGAMTPEEAGNAADYWRYAPHVSFLALAALVTWIGEVARAKAWRPVNWPAFWPLAPLAALALIPAAALVAPTGKPWPVHFRMVGREAYTLLPDHSVVVILGGYHLDAFGTAMKFDLSGQATPTDRKVRGLLHPGDFPDVIADVKRGLVTHVLVTDYFWNLDAEHRVVGIPPFKGETGLYAWSGEHWRKLGSWPVPPRP